MDVYIIYFNFTEKMYILNVHKRLYNLIYVSCPLQSRAIVKVTLAST